LPFEYFWSVPFKSGSNKKKLVSIKEGAIFVFLAKIGKRKTIGEAKNFRLKIGDFEAKAQTAPHYKLLFFSCL